MSCHPKAPLTLNSLAENEQLETIKTRYNGKIPEPPEEYVIDGFRYPSNGDFVLTTTDPPKVRYVDWVDYEEGYRGRGLPYLVLRRKYPDRTLTPYTYQGSVSTTPQELYGWDLVKKPLPEGWIARCFRFVRPGEHYLGKDGEICQYDGKSLKFVAMVIMKERPDGRYEKA